MSLNSAERERAEKGLREVTKRYGILFDSAPIMMHSIDRDGKLVRVNDSWLQRLGYKRDEVLGRQVVELMTDESSEIAVKETLPIFWRVGSARNVGYQFVSKNGSVLDILLDAEVSTDNVVDAFTLSALRDGHDFIQRRQASATLSELHRLIRLGSELEAVLSAGVADQSSGGLTELKDPSGYLLKVDERYAVLLEYAQDISASLRGLLRVQEERIDTILEQRSELLLVARTIEKTLAELGDTIAADRSKSL